MIELDNNFNEELLKIFNITAECWADIRNVLNDYDWLDAEKIFFLYRFLMDWIYDALLKKWKPNHQNRQDRWMFEINKYGDDWFVFRSYWNDIIFFFDKEKKSFHMPFYVGNMSPLWISDTYPDISIYPFTDKKYLWLDYKLDTYWLDKLLNKFLHFIYFLNLINFALYMVRNLDIKNPFVDLFVKEKWRNKYYIIKKNLTSTKIIDIDYLIVYWYLWMNDPYNNFFLFIHYINLMHNIKLQKKKFQKGWPSKPSKEKVFWVWDIKTVNWFNF